MDTIVLIVIGLAITLVLLGVSWARHPALHRVALRGAGIALVAAIVVGVVMLVVTTVFFNGRNSVGTITLDAAFSFGLLVGAILGAGYFWLNLVVLAIGMWLKPGDRLAFGAAVATPIVLAALGFGFTAYNAYLYEQGQPPTTSGTFTLEMDGARVGHVSATGAATCTLQLDGGLSVDATQPARDGRQIDIQLRVPSTGDATGVAIAVDQSQAVPGRGWEPGPDTIQLVAGWSRAQGQMTFSGLVPLDPNGDPDPTERWSGSLGWTCATP